jgi:hypothetical protein
VALRRLGSGGCRLKRQKGRAEAARLRYKEDSPGKIDSRVALAVAPSLRADALIDC